MNVFTTCVLPGIFLMNANRYDKYASHYDINANHCGFRYFSLLFYFELGKILLLLVVIGCFIVK